MREQKGYIFHKGRSWFVRYCDDVLQPDGAIKRKLVCKKLSVDYSGAYRTKESVKPFVRELLTPINSGLLNPQSTMAITDFVEELYLPKLAEKKRRSTMRAYRFIWQIHLKTRIGKMTLRDFRTVDGERTMEDIAARRKDLTHNSLARIKTFLSAAFKEAKRLGILDGENPVRDVSTPLGAKAKPTYAYSPEEVKNMLVMLDEPARTVVLTAALSGLREGEIRGLEWSDFNGRELSVKRSIWKKFVNDPKTASSEAPVPVVKQLADGLEAHRRRMGALAVGYIFQAGNGNPLNLDNLARRVIAPALKAIRVKWHGWHAFRRGLATNLHRLGVADREIQAILRHSDIRLTQKHYIKSVEESQVNAMNLLGAKLETELSCTNLATTEREIIN